ncbi:3-hydroxyacyl-CoA dehydrogenase-like protein lam1, variant 2 [Ascochyta rabiei]|uniref:3-hydroxyacyl-CoA dehydrogenase n=1 Tax=Didymella rabiei TaxID=5454 RepID=A0A162Z325_DIDRA|nr:3-hydroxyacyl-CoA dehydrogenase-like protein lam1, variant 2 [Ascochyta rabiei]KZM20371.1 3-hydroxyacyl-CoA dehydrogenase [Ascochyta rabiei]UPX16534.1 3-hydroxyacyl-CoA dehydrogenase-like protein lam1, variant 2 [Ascochyta rabiei]
MLTGAACCWAAGGYTVHLYDPDEKQRSDAELYFHENKAAYRRDASRPIGQLISHTVLDSAVCNAWHVIECVPEVLHIKQEVFARLEKLVARDSILATNSSSYRSSLVVGHLDSATKCRALNTHYYMPPYVRAVELMTSGTTDSELFAYLAQRMEDVGLKPFFVKKESTGFIQNRVWAAIKREMVQVVSEGVADPKTADDIFFETVVMPGLRPFVAMDLVGLDTVVKIEQHYAQERKLPMEHTIEFLKREFIDKGKLGLKSRDGGFYPPKQAAVTGPRLFVCENGLSGQVDNLETGKVLEYSAAGQFQRTIFENQYLPDGIVVLKEEGMMFWTCMGFPGQDDGMVYSARLDGTSLRPIVSKGTMNTPKQIALDEVDKKLYIADREGLGIWRCNLDGSNLEKIIETGDKDKKEDQRDATRWCVGITLSHRLGKLFWTQKGAAKGWQGRIFSANIATPPGETATNRTDKVCLLEGLAEPVDLDFHEESSSLYWTDRGEMPFGNTLNKLPLDKHGQAVNEDYTPLLKHQILARKFHEAIGLKIDAQNQHVYVADLGGSICRCNLDGSEKTRLVFEEGRAWTGISLA